MGGVGNGAAEEDWHRDLNPGAAARPKGGPRSFGRVGTPWRFVKEFFGFSMFAATETFLFYMWIVNFLRIRNQKNAITVPD